MSKTIPLFRFSQTEIPWALGPPDGRYLLRRANDPPDAPPAHVLVLATLGVPERRRIQRKKYPAQPEPEPTPVTTGRATIIDVARPLQSMDEARRWLGHAGEEQFALDLRILNRALHAFRLVTADPYLNAVSRHQALVARIGFGAGEEVADGLWTDAHELIATSPRQRRAKVLQPQARLAAVLTGRERILACEELALRGRLDLDHGRDREAAFQVLVALDAALAELAAEKTAAILADRLLQLRGQRDAIASAAQAALAGALAAPEREAVAFTLGRIEAALRARAVANA